MAVVGASTWWTMCAVYHADPAHMVHEGPDKHPSLEFVRPAHLHVRECSRDSAQGIVTSNTRK